jgi:hypothetical protein
VTKLSPEHEGGGDALEAVLESSRAGAQRVERGRFKLDWKRALDKIKDFQLTDPHRYVLELVQAAVAGGASSIRVSTDADDMFMTFDRLRCSQQDLERLFDYLFTREAEHAPLRQLALGANAALGLQPKFIQIDSGDGSRGTRARLTSHTDLALEVLPPEAMLDGTRIHVRERVSWKMVSKAMGSTSVEGQLLAEQCRFCPIELFLNGEDLRRPLSVTAVARHDLAPGPQGIRGELLLLPPTSRGGSAIVLCMNGVQVGALQPEERSWYGLPVHGVVDASSLTRNASHSDVVRDAAFREMLRQVTTGVRMLTRTWLKQTLPLADDALLQPSLRTHLLAAAKLLLRIGRKHDHPPEVDALLDVPATVELAVSEPGALSLRPIWDHVRSTGRCQSGSRRYNLALDDLPAEAGLPVLWPSELLAPIVGNKVESVDNVLEQVAGRVYNRRQREADPREPVLEPGAALVKVALDDRAHKMKGEFGLSLDRFHSRRQPRGGAEAVDALLATLDDRHGAVNGPGQDDSPDDGASGDEELVGESFVRVTFLRNRVLLGERLVRDEAINGLAVLDCPDFEPTDDWTDIEKNEAYRNVGQVLGRRLPALLQELQRAFPALPPPLALQGAGGWAPDAEELAPIPTSLRDRWPSDDAAALARFHADRLLPRCPRQEGTQAAWLLEWPIFHTLDGEAWSLRRLLDDGRRIRHVVEQPWGAGAPDDTLLLNITNEQKRVLQRYLPGKLRNNQQLLSRRRTDLEQEHRLQRERMRNLNAAELRRQAPTLEAGRYHAIVDLELAEGGCGQAGIPRQQDEGWLRLLVDGLPLPDVELQGLPFCVQAVIQAPQIEADAAWGGIAAACRKEVNGLRRKVVGAVPELVDALVQSAGDTVVGTDLIWRFLRATSTPKKDPLRALPPALVQHPLLPSVDRGQVSLGQVMESFKEHGGKVLFTGMRQGRQLTKRPILVLDDGGAKLLRKLLHVQLRDYSRELTAEREALTKLDQPLQPPYLQVPTAIKVKLHGPEIQGELGVPYPLDDEKGKGKGKGHRSTVQLLRQGIPLQRRQLKIRDLELVGLVECPRFTPTPRYDGIVVNEAWVAARAALRAAADRLVLKGCQALTRGELSGLDKLAVVQTLQEAAGRRFRGDADLALAGAPALDWQLAGAPLWENADTDGPALTLLQLRDASVERGRLWVVGEKRGHVAPGRTIVRAPDARSDAALTAIFGDRIRDGARVLARDDKAHHRRTNAPLLAARLSPERVAAAAPVVYDADAASHGMTVRGEVGPWRAYDDKSSGLRLLLGVEGRLLCTIEVQHPLRGVGQLDCQGLIPNRDWLSVADPRQLELLRELSAAALWEATEEVARRAQQRLTRGIAEDEQVRRLLLDALDAQLAADEPRPTLLALLKELPLYRSVQGQPLSAAQLEVHVAEAGKLLLVGEQRDEGTPGDGRLIVRTGAVALQTLANLLGTDQLETHDEAWEEELAGQRRRRETTPSKPQVSEQSVVLLPFHRGPTSGLAGLLPPVRSGYTEPAQDRRSLVELHIDRRLVAKKTPHWHPPVHVWINDDRLRPARSFRDVVEDAVYAEVMELAQGQTLELVARAADRCEGRWEDDPDDPLRRRIALYVLAQLQALRAASEAGRGPERTLMRTNLWDCLTAKRRRLIDTRRLLQAHAAGRLATANPSVENLPGDKEMVVVRAIGAERQHLLTALGSLPDYTSQLKRDEAHRVFLQYKRHRRIDLDAMSARPSEDYLWRAALTESGWEGELGLLAEPGGKMLVHIFTESRQLVVHQIDGPVAAICAVQFEGLSPNDAFSDVERDDAFASWYEALRQTVLAALEQVAAAQEQETSSPRRRAMAGVLLNALASLAARQSSEEGVARLVGRLRELPALDDTAGRRWSVAALREQAEAHQTVACVFPETAAQTRHDDDQLVLVLDSGAHRVLSKLVPLSRVDADYAAAAAARQRMKKAPRKVDVPWSRSVARAEVIDEALGLRGELALSVPPAQGTLALLAGGLVVQQRLFNEMPGLLGYLDGELTPDRAFKKVELTTPQRQLIRQLYEARLEQSLAEAEAGGLSKRRSARAQALCFYALVYLRHKLKGLAGNQAERRSKVLARLDLAAPLLRALDLKVFERHDGSWIDLATLVSGEDPLVVLCDSPDVYDPSDGEALLVINNGLMRQLLESVLGRRSVVIHNRWRWKGKKAAKGKGKGKGKGPKAAKAAKAAKGRAAGSAKASADRVLSGLRSALRDGVGQAKGSPLSLKLLGRIQGEDLGRSGLADVERKNDRVKRLRVNRDHPTWKAFVQAAEASGPTPVLHLAAAYIMDLARLEPPVLSWGETLTLLEHLAARAVTRED